MIGQTVSHYKILEKLGEGGMGVVYKAHDTKLDRDVALKFLPHHLTATTDEQARFLQEARAASALNHPNVCTIYDIAEHDGQQFIVMECIDGKTLRQMVPVQKMQTAIDYAIQIGDALQEAHSKGIVHRDIKTDNIMVNSKNQIKVMDFGLAKLKGSLKLTKTSSTVGTLAYMAPEQIQGGEVDARSDIFSFGVVLYEMLTGHMPFRGEHEAAMVYSIVNEEPTPVEKYLPDISSELVHILNRALEKDPEDRYQFVHEMVIDLRRLKKQTSKVSMPAFNQIGQHSFTWKQSAFVGLSVVIIAALVLVFIIPSSRKMPQLNPNAKMHTVPMQVTNTSYPCLSSDGNWIALGGADANGRWDVYFMNASGGDVRRITYDSSDNVYVGEISRDGAWLVYTRRNKRILENVIVPSQGGKTQTVCIGGMPRWTIDNQRILYIGAIKFGTYEVWSIRRDGTDSRPEFLNPGIRGNQVSLSLSPDGKSVAWIKTFPDFSNDIITHNLETGHESQITFTKSVIDEVFWTADNFIIYSSNRSGNFDLWMCPADGGESIQITRSTSAKIRAQISADGRKLLYSEHQMVGNIKILNLESGKVSAITSDDLDRAGLSISPDNQRLAFMPTNAYPDVITTYGIHVIDRRKPESPSSLVSEVRTGNYTAWSPDGQWIAFTKRPNSVDEPYKICIVSPSSPASFKVIGNGEQDSSGIASGVFIKWLDEHTLEWFAPKQVKTWKSSIDNPNPQQLYDDSTRAYPIQEGRYILFRDYRRGRQGWWIDMSPAVTKASNRIINKILGPTNVSVAPDGQFLLYRTSSSEILKVSLPDGKVQHLPIHIQNISENFGSEGIGAITLEGKELAYIESITTGKVVLVENPFMWK